MFVYIEAIIRYITHLHLLYFVVIHYICCIFLMTLVVIKKWPFSFSNNALPWTLLFLVLINNYNKIELFVCWSKAKSSVSFIFNLFVPFLSSSVVVVVTFLLSGLSIFLFYLECVVHLLSIFMDIIGFKTAIFIFVSICL